MRRRSLFAALLAFPVTLGARLRPQTDTEALPCLPGFRHACNEVMNFPPTPVGRALGTIYASGWAKAFVAHVRQNPSIATDEETMTRWVANAIMPGYERGDYDVHKRWAEFRCEPNIPAMRRYFDAVDRATPAGRGGCSYDTPLRPPGESR